MFTDIATKLLSPYMFFKFDSLNSTIPGLFSLYFSLSYTLYLLQLIVNKSADDWIRTTDL